MTIDSRFYQLIAHLWRGGKYGYYFTTNNGEGNNYTYWVAVPAAGVTATERRS